VKPLGSLWNISLVVALKECSGTQTYRIQRLLTQA
jgi:hypothetical protein